MDGFQVLGRMPSGVCNVSGTPHTVRSHQDATFGCVLPLNLAELAAYCSVCGGPLAVVPCRGPELISLRLQQGLAAAHLQYAATVLGQFGNADLNDVSQWVTISKEATSM